MEHWLHCAIPFIVYHHLVSKGLSSFPKSSVKTHQQLLTDAPRKLHLNSMVLKNCDSPEISGARDSPCPFLQWMKTTELVDKICYKLL